MRQQAAVRAAGAHAIAPTPDRPAPASCRGRAVVVAAVLVLVVGQRLAIPLGGSGDQLSLVVPAVLAVVAVGFARGYLVVDRTRAVLLGVSLVALGAVSVVAVIRDLHPSLLSLLLYVAIYAVAPVRLADPRAARRGLEFFVDLMLVAAAVGLALFVLEYAGVAHVDYLAEVVPSDLLLAGYNTANPIEYGSMVYRSNAVVFLEPSFFSLFLGLATVVSVATARRLWLLPLLLAALAATAAGSGVVVILVSVLWVLLTGPRRQLLPLLPAAALAVVLATVTPLGSLFVERSGELATADSSASLRFVQPYTLLAPTYVHDPLAALVGGGAGSAQRVVERQVGDVAVIVPAVIKLLVEYGWVGAIPALLFLVQVLCAQFRRAPWAPGLAVVYLAVNASLLQPTLALLTILFCAVLVPPGPVDQRTPDAPDPLDPPDPGISADTVSGDSRHPGSVHGVV